MTQYFENNDRLKNNRESHQVIIKDQRYTFITDNGVFSKRGLDFGTRTLLETIPLDRINGNVLDVGCGYGFMGVSLAKIKNAHVTMCDVNKRALHLAEKNALENGVSNSVKVIESDIYQNITDIYDLIITNPPIRAGKNVVYGILDGARDRLKAKGELWFVIRKDQGAKSTIKHVEENYDVEVVTKSKGFYIVKATKR